MANDVSVLLIAGSFYPREGGAERQMRQLLWRYAENGEWSRVISQALPERPRTEVIANRIVVHRVGHPWLYANLPRVAQAYFVLAAIASGRRIRPKAVVSLQLGAASVAASVVSRIRSVRHVVRLTGGGTSRHRSEPLARSSSRIGECLVKFISKSRPVIGAPANHLLADFEESFPAVALRSAYIPNGVQYAETSSLRDKDVVWYSRRGAVQSFELFCRVARGMPTVGFTIIGNLPIGVSVPENATYEGWLEEPSAVIARHKVLLNTSPYEGMPNTALQALSLGVRVVGLSNAGLRELQAEYHEYVGCVRSSDPNRITEAIKNALKLPIGAPRTVPTLDDSMLAWQEVLTPVEG